MIFYYVTLGYLLVLYTIVLRFFCNKALRELTNIVKVNTLSDVAAFLRFLQRHATYSSPTDATMQEMNKFLHSIEERETGRERDKGDGDRDSSSREQSVYPAGPPTFISGARYKGCKTCNILPPIHTIHTLLPIHTIQLR
jgi:hypothetical protein